MDEMNLLWKDWLDGREHFVYHILCTYHRCINAFNDFFQEIDISVFFSHDPFPIPLVHVKGV